MIKIAIAIKSLIAGAITLGAEAAQYSLTSRDLHRVRVECAALKRANQRLLDEVDRLRADAASPKLPVHPVDPNPYDVT